MTASRHKPLLKQIPIHQLRPGRYQMRRVFDATALQELANSITENGLVQPLIVRPISNDIFEIVAGERRWRGAKIANQTTVPCLVYAYTDEQAAAVASVENVQRVDLNPIEEAKSYARMIEAFDYLQEEVAAIVGKSRTKITNMLRLLSLDPSVQQLLIDKMLTEGHGKVLASASKSLQKKLAEQCVKKHWSVRSLEKAVKAALEKNEVTTVKDPNIAAIENALGEHIGCKVQIDHDDKTCRLHIDCHSLEIFQGVLDKMGFKEKH